MAKLKTISSPLLALILCCPFLHAGDIDPLLTTTFKGKTLFLRGFPQDDSLAYNAGGQPKKPYKTGSWTLSDGDKRCFL